MSGEREEYGDGWYVQQRGEGVWVVTRNGWNEDGTPARQVYYADIQLDPRTSCEHQKWYLARWTPYPDRVFDVEMPGDWPYPAETFFTLHGRYESVDEAFYAVCELNFWAHEHPPAR